MPSKEVELDVKVKLVTDKAIQIETERGTNWVPKSQITDYSGSELLDHNVTSIFIPEWLASEKGLI